MQPVKRLVDEVDRSPGSRTSLESVMNGDRFHADPHPGNVMVLSDGRLGLLDLGSTGRLDAIEQASIAGMLTAIHDNDPELLRQAVGYRVRLR